MTRRRVDSNSLGTNRRFDFTAYIGRICMAFCQQIPELSHIQCSRICFAYTRARQRTGHGIFASLTPLRFPGGSLEGKKRNRKYRIQRVIDPQGEDFLYILTCYLPRFMDQVFREKLITLVHELWHISPQFDGDIRRHEGRCYAHTHSQKEYDEQMGVMVDRYLASQMDLSHLAPLRLEFDQMLTEYGGVFGTRVKRPRLIPTA